MRSTIGMRKINPGPFCTEQLAETENHSTLVLAQDADHLRQDDHGE